MSHAKILFELSDGKASGMVVGEKNDILNLLIGIMKEEDPVLNLFTYAVAAAHKVKAGEQPPNPDDFGF